MLENALISNVMKIRPLGAEFHAGRWTERQDEASSLWSKVIQISVTFHPHTVHW